MISLGIDLGGTQIKYGLVEDGKILDCGICDTRLKRDTRQLYTGWLTVPKAFCGVRRLSL